MQRKPYHNSNFHDPKVWVITLTNGHIGDLVDMPNFIEIFHAPPGPKMVMMNTEIDDLQSLSFRMKEGVLKVIES